LKLSQKHQCFSSEQTCRELVSKIFTTSTTQSPLPLGVPWFNVFPINRIFFMMTFNFSELLSWLAYQRWVPSWSTWIPNVKKIKIQGSNAYLLTSGWHSLQILPNIPNLRGKEESWIAKSHEQVNNRNPKKLSMYDLWLKLNLESKYSKLRFNPWHLH